MKTPSTSIIPGEDTIIHTNDIPNSGQNDTGVIKSSPARLNIDEKLFILSNYRLDTDNGELFVAMFG